MPRYVSAMPDLPPIVREEIERLTEEGGPLQIVHVGAGAMTVFVEKEKLMLVSSWVPLGLDPNRAGLTPLYRYRRELTERPTVDSVKAMLLEFHSRE